MFYVMFAIDHGVSGRLAQERVTVTLMTVTVSILLHGVSVRPPMNRYARRHLPRR